MIRICMYCKTVIGEKEPLENKRLTHTVCEKCMPQHNKNWGVKKVLDNK